MFTRLSIMRKLILGILLIIPAAVMATQVTVDKSITCNTASEIISYLVKTHGEVPVWIGDKKDSNTAILANPKTKSWTIILFQLEKDIACVLEAGVGYEFKFINPV